MTGDLRTGHLACSGTAAHGKRSGERDSRTSNILWKMLPSTKIMRWVWGIVGVAPVLFICATVAIKKSRQHGQPEPINDRDWNAAVEWRFTKDYTNARDTFISVKKAAVTRGDFSDDELQYLVSSMQNTQQFYMRVTALGLVSKATTEHSKAVLKPNVLTCLNDDVAFVRAAAAEALVFLGDKNTITNLDPLLHDPEPHVAALAKKAKGLLAEKQK